MRDEIMSMILNSNMLNTQSSIRITQSSMLITEISVEIPYNSTVTDANAVR